MATVEKFLHPEIDFLCKYTRYFRWNLTKYLQNNMFFRMKNFELTPSVPCKLIISEFKSIIILWVQKSHFSVEISGGNKFLVFRKYGHVPLYPKNMKSIRPILTYMGPHHWQGPTLSLLEHRMNGSFKDLQRILRGFRIFK